MIFYWMIFKIFIKRLPKGAAKLFPLPLHAGLSIDEQMRIFEPTESGTRKVIIATNIAEVLFQPIICVHKMTYFW